MRSRATDKTKAGRSYGNAGVVESVESQKQASHSFHESLENLAPTPARFPHSHSSDDEGVEKWKTKIRFPTFPPPRIPSLNAQRPTGGRASPSAERGAPAAYK